MAVSEGRTIRFGPFELDPQCGELRKDGTHLKLQGQPIEILELLLAKHGELVSREEIRQRLWRDDTFVDFEHSLNTAIKKLRHALGDEALEPQYIETLPKRGYRFVAQVENSGPAVIPFPTGNSAPTARSSGSTQWIWYVAGIVTLLLTALVARGLFRPISMPRIVATHVLTHSGYPKSNLVTDGRMLYFIEQRPAGPTIMSLPITGGEPREIATVPDLTLFSVSSDGSQILVNIVNRQERRWDAWIMPLPSGPRRLIIKDAYEPTWTPDGHHILFIRFSKEGAYKVLYRARADGSDSHAVVRDLIPADWQVVISPDGKRVLLRESTTGITREAAPDGSEPRPIPSIKRGSSIGVWSPDGKYYFFNAPGSEPNQSTLDVLGTDRSWWGKARSRSLLLSPLAVSEGFPAISSDGSKVFVNTVLRRGELTVFDQKSGQFIPYALPISASYTDYSPDGQWIAYVSYPDAVLWRSRIDGTDRMQLTSPPTLPFRPQWSPDGKLILFTDMPSEATGFARSNIYAVSAEGGEPLLLLAGAPFAADATWSADGSEIAYSEGKDFYARRHIRVLNLKSSKSVELPGSSDLYSPRWSPDGKYILALSFPPTRLMLYSVTTQQWQEVASSTAFGWPNWTRDSKYIQLFEGSQIVRVNVSTFQKQVVADSSAVAQVDVYYPCWLGITPDGRPITTRDTGTHEIYAFDLEYK